MLAAAPFRLLLLLGAVVGTLLLATVDGHGDGSDGDASSRAADALARHAHGRRLSSACAARGRRGLSGCPLAPASTAGPFATDTGVVRRNITEGLPGVPFVLDVELVHSSNCTGVEGAAVEIWHCDALGEYSAFAAAGGAFTPTDTTFMRGVQFTNASGVARFETVFPGWYNGRTTHIHVRVHEGLSLGAAAADGSRAYSGGTSVHTGQLYFEDAVADAVALLAPYDTRSTTRKPLLSDGLYTNNGGGIVAVTATDAAAGPGDYAGGVYGTATLGIDFAAAGQQQTGAAAGRPALQLAALAAAAVAATASGTAGGRGLW